jgi:hypothetical protein
MWQLPTNFLCQKHLLGEHGEIHKHKHNFEKHHSISGRISPIVLIEPESMQKRHDELAQEMIRRGYNHQSPYEQPDLSYLSDNERYAKVDLDYNIRDLMDRCPECKERILESKGENYETNS